MIDIRNHGGAYGGGSGGNAGMNLYVQPTEPKGQEGIWIKSDTKGTINKIVSDTSVYASGNFDQTYKNKPVNIQYRLQQAFVGLNGKTYAFGGYKQNETSVYRHANDLYSHDVEVGTWTALPANQTIGSPHSFAFGSYGENIVICGGGSDSMANSLPSVHIYNTNTRTWSKGADMPWSKAQGLYCQEGKYLYYMGGIDNGTNKRYDMYKIDMTNGSSTKLTAQLDVNTWGFDCNAQIVNGQLYILGGSLGKIYKLDLENGTTFAALNDTRQKKMINAMSVSYNGKIYTFGGGVGDGTHYTYSNEVYCYNPIDNSWVKKKSMPIPVKCDGYMNNCFVWNNKAYIYDNSFILVYDFMSDTWKRNPYVQSGSINSRAVTVGTKIFYANTYFYDVATNEGNFTKLWC